jgi:hypothetical protein
MIRVVVTPKKAANRYGLLVRKEVDLAHLGRNRTRANAVVTRGLSWSYPSDR